MHISDIDFHHIPRGVELKNNSILHSNPGPRGSSQKLAITYFKSLTKDQIEKLINIYKWDFQLFEYEYQSFLDLGIDE